MMRGTVYLEGVHAVTLKPIFRRVVKSYPVADPDDFERAFIEEAKGTPCAVSFGPIAPPWGLR